MNRVLRRLLTGAAVPAIALLLAMPAAGQFDGIIVTEDPPEGLLLFAAGPNVRMGSEEVLEDPGTLVGYRTPENLGTSYLFRVTGSLSGIVWGSDIYTDDTLLAAAAVHAGVVKPDETAVVRVTILPGRPAYRGSEQNGVSSQSYASWSGSYMIDRTDMESKEEPDVAESTAPTTMRGVEGEIGETFTYLITGSASPGWIWGTDVYTDDSSLALAAVHSGALEDGETGMIRVTLLPGRTFYNGMDRNGVTSYPYGDFPRSYMIDREEDEEQIFDGILQFEGVIER